MFLLIWFFIILISAAILLPILKALGVINVQWKWVLSPIWGPILVVVGWIFIIMTPIFVLSCSVLVLVGGNGAPI